jgi:SAM-dependent methyltransferase
MFGPWIGGPGAVRLNVGCADNKVDGFLNLDMDERVRPDVQWDVETTPLPFADSTFDCILASHVLEHVHRIIPLVYDFHRILKPGGHLIAVTPYGGSDDAWEAPQHVTYFTDKTWAYFSDRLYDAQQTAGSGARQGYRYADWEFITVRMIPYPEFVDDPEIEFKRRHWRNVIQEVHAVLKKGGDK